MKFSTKAEYGLKAMTNLAKKYPEKKSLSFIAQEENVSEKYLERIIALLKSHDLVMSTKGAKGGYVLSRHPKKINVGEIIEILEGTIAPMKCAEVDFSRCQAVGCDCASRTVWIKLEKQIRKTLYAIKLSDLV